MSTIRHTISEAASIAGVPVHTIKFYIREGLLPGPHKTARNRGYYDGNFMARLAILIDLKKRRKLPLKIIREVLKSLGPHPTIADAELTLASRERLDGPSGHAGEQHKSLEDLVHRTGLAEKTIREFERQGLIVIQDAGEEPFLSAEDARIVEVIGGLRRLGFQSLGFTAKDFGMYVKAAKNLVSLEMKLFSERLIGKVEPESLPGLVSEGTMQVDLLMGLLHKKYLMDAMKKTCEAKEEK